MVPKQELQALAAALKSTPEFAAVTRQRRLILNSSMGPMMQGFEREHKRLSALSISEKETEERFNRLYTVYGPFLAHPSVKEYMRASQAYERMVSESIEYLHSIVAVGGPVIRR